MRCPDCGGKLRVYRTYRVSDTHRRHYRKCVDCGEGFKTEEFLGDRLTADKRANTVDALKYWGLSDIKARQLAKAYPASVLKEYSSNLLSIINSYEAKNGPVRDKASFLAWAIEKQYSDNGNGLNGHQNGQEPPIFDLPETTPPTMEEAAWQEACSTLQRQMTRATYNAVIAPTRLMSVQDGVAIIAVKSDTAKAWLENRLRDLVQGALASVIEDVEDVKFLLEKMHANEA